MVKVFKSIGLAIIGAIVVVLAIILLGFILGLMPFLTLGFIFWRFFDFLIERKRLKLKAQVRIEQIKKMH